jgi:hypothetical protein
MPIPFRLTLIAAAAALVLPGALRAQAVDSTQLAGTRTYTPRSIEQQMTPEERQATGVMRLTPSQRRALAAWTARRIAAASAASAAARDSLERAPAAPASSPSAGYEPSGAADASLSSAPAHTYGLREIREGGRFVVLGDGALWEVAPEDRPTASAWTAGAVVTLDPIDAPTGDWSTAIREARSARSVAARFAGRAP